MAERDPPIDRTPPDEPLAAVVTGRRGRPESETTADPPAYGEPKGPRPPQFKILPKDEIEKPPQERAAAPERNAERSAPTSRYEDERERHGFHSGMTTPATRQTTAGPREKVVRRELPTFKGEEPNDDGNAT